MTAAVVAKVHVRAWTGFVEVGWKLELVIAAAVNGDVLHDHFLKQLAKAAFAVLTLGDLLKLKKHFRVLSREAEALDNPPLTKDFLLTVIILAVIITCNYYTFFLSFLLSFFFTQTF